MSGDTALAKKMGVPYDTVKNWKSRGVPLKYALQAKKETNASLDWIYEGNSSVVYETKNGYKIDAHAMSLSAASLSDTQRIAVEEVVVALQKMIDQFKTSNEKEALLKEYSERLSELEKRK